MSSNSEKYLLFFAIFVLRKGYPAKNRFLKESML